MLGPLAEKIRLIEIRDGLWQTQLRTLVRYGGLNKKYGQAISNKRKATLRSKILANSSVNQNLTRSNPKIPPYIETTTKTIPTLTQVPNSKPPLIRRSRHLQQLSQSQIT